MLAAEAWSIGVERETSPGVYAQLVSISQGWLLWRFETINGVYPIAGKAFEGGRPPVPLGVAQALFCGGLFMHFGPLRDLPINGYVSGTYPHKLKTEMRIVGERFVRPAPSVINPEAFDGKRLEFFVTSMPGPRSYSKAKVDQGVLDMTGAAAAVAAARSLVRSGGGND